MVFGLFRRAAKAAYEAPLPTTIVPMPHPAPDVPAAPPTIRPTTEAAPVLWQGTAYGMTIEDVRRIRPDAVASTDDRRLGDGTVCMLEIVPLRLAAHDYSVLFYFRNSTLSQVTIATNGSPAFSDFHDMVNALRLRYGTEVEYKVVPDGFCTGEWLAADGVNVTIVFQAAIECLNVNFQYRYGHAAMQL
jgi:hypothetical protein